MEQKTQKLLCSFVSGVHTEQDSSTWEMKKILTVRNQDILRNQRLLGQRCYRTMMLRDPWGCVRWVTSGQTPPYFGY